ncbi:hypothetical protein [Eisenibacter elegans]|uniref:hypothetical protein n=1 Tax=Eisenibacter elegans TaxID=997 RepID=UPI000401AF89|nr:hypothetical protein [Eisenibacter elegans]
MLSPLRTLRSIVLFLCFFPEYSQAQKPFAFADISAAANGESSWQFSLSASRVHPVALQKRFSIGYGLRFSSFSGQTLNYISAPPALAADQTKQAQWRIEDPLVHFLNAEIHLHGQLSNRWEAGFNIDALGFGWGPARTGALFIDGQPQVERGSPTRPNVLLIGNNDIGSLNANGYIGYRIAQKWAVLGSYSHIYTEYTLDRAVPENFDNDRFRNKSWLIRLALRYHLSR